MSFRLFTRVTNSDGDVQDVLQVANTQLQPWVHSPQSQALLAQKPGQDVTFTHGSIKPKHIESARHSYINAILIQSRGAVLNRACDRCLKGAARARKQSSSQRFLDCRRVRGHFGGCCANCKWPDAARKCSYVWDEEDEEEEEEEDDDGSGRKSGDESGIASRIPESCNKIEEGATHSDLKGIIRIKSEDNEEEIRYENVSAARKSEQYRNEMEDNDILQKLLLPDYAKDPARGLKRSLSPRRPLTPEIKEEAYSSEEEWEGFSP